MTKIVTVQSQQRWDYSFESRRTEVSLLATLNELGQQGWELVDAMTYKDAKGIVSWGAYLKRPSVAQTTAPSQPAVAAVVSAHVNHADNKPQPLQGFDLSGDDFRRQIGGADIPVCQQGRGGGWIGQTRMSAPPACVPVWPWQGDKSHPPWREHDRAFKRGGQ